MEHLLKDYTVCGAWGSRFLSFFCTMNIRVLITFDSPNVFSFLFLELIKNLKESTRAKFHQKKHH